jgi:hypothetical protein
MPSLIFSKSQEGTVLKVVPVKPSVVVSSSGLSYNMIDRLANSTKCGRCRGAK